MKNFGIERVVEPKNSTPVTAWKLDNSRELKSGEIRIGIKRIVFERENLDQLYSICDYEDERTIARIFKIIEERGKLHNPYTESSGLFQGVIEEAAPGYDLEGRGLALGDQVICMAPIAGLPLKLDKISEIDYFFSTIECEGYTVCFETTNLIKVENLDKSHSIHLLRALEEEGNFYAIGEVAKDSKIDRAVLLGSNLAESILYSRLLKDMNPDIEVDFVCDSAYENVTGASVIKEIFGNLVEKIFFVNLSDPVAASKQILGPEGSKPIDLVINMENIKGTESVASMVVRDYGMVYYTSMVNRYTTGLLVSDSLGKNILNYALDGFCSGSFNMAMKLVEGAEEALFRLDAYNKKRPKIRGRNKGAKISKVENAVQQIDDFAFSSPITASMLEEALNIAQYDCSVIIQGETGVGKEKIFNLLHQNSSRKDKACIKINCATIQESLAESEFFGYEKGAFTGANSTGKAGYFEMANNGTLFLDEIGSLSLNMQSKLLRVLQDNIYYPVGATEPKHVNVRVICANNVPLKKLIEQGEFREDLYYRLNICQINVPPLRVRNEDIRCLAQVFMEQYSKKYGKSKVISEEAYRLLEGYHWPGNVRELENMVHRLYIAEKSDVIDEYTVDMMLNDSVLEDTMLDIKKEISWDKSVDFLKIMDRQEKRLIEYALKKEGTTRKAAEFLGLPQTTLARKKLKHNL